MPEAKHQPFLFSIPLFSFLEELRHISSFNSENEIMAGGNILLFHQEYGQQFLVVALSCIVDALHAIYISTNYFFYFSKKPFLVSFTLSYDRL